MMGRRFDFEVIFSLDMKVQKVNAQVRQVGDVGDIEGCDVEQMVGMVLKMDFFGQLGRKLVFIINNNNSIEVVWFMCIILLVVGLWQYRQLGYLYLEDQFYILKRREINLGRYFINLVIDMLECGGI